MPLLCCCCYCFMLLSWNCLCACATTDESQQQQQYYTVTTIVKQLMITKILNNLYVVVAVVVVIVVIMSFICNMKRPSVKQSMKHKSIQIWQANLLWLMDPPVNWAWISGRPLHHLEDEPTLGNGPPSQSNMDLWKTITPNNFHNRLTPPPPLDDHRSMEDHYTI